jgi:hypothetical protein
MHVRRKSRGTAFAPGSMGMAPIAMSPGSILGSSDGSPTWTRANEPLAGPDAATGCGCCRSFCPVKFWAGLAASGQERDINPRTNSVSLPITENVFCSRSRSVSASASSGRTLRAMPWRSQADYSEGHVGGWIDIRGRPLLNGAPAASCRMRRRWITRPWISCARAALRS